ncbi:MAG: RidA family protein [Halieaceae bacterium]|nr:RidA family protein [Halieaceae bacterium]
MVFISGQTPRQTEGQRLSEASFEIQVHQTLANLMAVAGARGLKPDDIVNVNLCRHTDCGEFDHVYRDYCKAPSVAGALVQLSFIDFDVEVDAVLLDPAGAA